MKMNPIVECPYDPKHKMKYTRLIYHLGGKCKTEPKVRHLYSICRYNWVHRVLKEELEDHHLTCNCRPPHFFEWKAPPQELFLENTWRTDLPPNKEVANEDNENELTIDFH